MSVKRVCDACGRECGEGGVTFETTGPPNTVAAFNARRIDLCGPRDGADVGCAQLLGAALAWIGNQKRLRDEPITTPTTSRRPTAAA